MPSSVDARLTEEARRNPYSLVRKSSFTVLRRFLARKKLSEAATMQTHSLFAT
jgi:hypothetical protein